MRIAVSNFWKLAIPVFAAAGLLPAQNGAEAARFLYNEQGGRLESLFSGIQPDEEAKAIFLHGGAFVRGAPPPRPEAPPSVSLRLHVPERTESFPGGDPAHYPMPAYRAGRVFSANRTLTAIRVDRIGGDPGTAVEQALDLPGSFRHTIGGIAVSFDGAIAVSATIMDEEGRFASVVAWLRADGSLVRAVRTSPFASSRIGFTADGSLWAFGIVKKKDRRGIEPVHDMVRRYAPDGKLTGSFLPRSELADALYPYPTESGFLATSRNYVAIVSGSVKKYALLTTEGDVMHQGDLDYPQGFGVVGGVVTDSGRIFVRGHWRGARNPQYPRSPFFEIDTASGALELVGISEVFPEGTSGLLLGAEGESLVFLERSGKDGERSNKLIWSQVN